MRKTIEIILVHFMQIRKLVICYQVVDVLHLGFEVDCRNVYVVRLLFGQICDDVEAEENLVQKPEEINKNRKLARLVKPENGRSFI